ncbi:MAG: mannose-6-phosphate isomerase [Deltaproteobacteria bacterium]|nr:mannose-6-phosphate isomerase [Deltaproteobacteria bacterium]
MKSLNTTVKKPWGQFDDLAEKKGKWHLKALKIKKGHRLSLQKHKKRSELWIVAEGKIKAQCGSKIYILFPPKNIFIKKNMIHRMYALLDSVVIEVSFGLHQEKDILRLEDDYGRNPR